MTMDAKIILMLKLNLEDYDMPRKAKEFKFHIEAYDPHTMPMKRLAEYMMDLADLLGEQKSVHFVSLSKGSTNIIHTVDNEAEERVLSRVHGARAGDGAADAVNAAQRLDKRLRDDNTSGALFGPAGDKIIAFPGKLRPGQLEFGPFNQPSIVDGVPIRIGGENDPVPVHLEDADGQVHICMASRKIAREIAPCIFVSVVRAEGVERCRRDTDGNWIRDKFTIQRFVVLDKMPLTDAIDRVREVSPALQNLDNPLAAALEIRTGQLPED